MKIFPAVYNEKAFSITELVLVVAVVGMIIVIFSALPNSIGLIGQSSHESLAKQIAQKKIEDIRSLGYENICDPQGGVCTESLTDSRLSKIPDSSAQVTISSCLPQVCTNGEAVKQVEVAIGWKDNGNQKSMKVLTMVSEGGLK